ncbi:MAG: retropepsin-like aspartic protease [Blastocatellales bacterium]
MLIDSGADVTLLPRSLVERLGIVPGAGYELMAFDGSVSISQAVQADLIFLRKIFKGQYLLLDQDSGVLGRDILNHVSLLLDGPHLQWEEQ